MAWDPSLLRKYNITSHFRLLNQVRSELKDQPLQRPLAGSRSEATARRSSRSTSNESPRRGRSAGSGAPTRSLPTPPVAVTPSPESNFDPIVMVPLITDAFDSQH